MLSNENFRCALADLKPAKPAKPAPKGHNKPVPEEGGEGGRGATLLELLERRQRELGMEESAVVSSGAWLIGLAVVAALCAGAAAWAFL